MANISKYIKALLHPSGGHQGTIGLIKLATKCRKAVGPSGNPAEMLKVTGEEGVELARQLTEQAVYNCGAIPADGE